MCRATLLYPVCPIPAVHYWDSQVVRAWSQLSCLVMFLFLTSIILSTCAVSPVLGDLHCESEVFHAQLVCVHSFESISAL